jgi:hypothetical protein
LAGIERHCLEIACHVALRGVSAEQIDRSASLFANYQTLRDVRVAMLTERDAVCAPFDRLMCCSLLVAAVSESGGYGFLGMVREPPEFISPPR